MPVPDRWQSPKSRRVSIGARPGLWNPFQNMNEWHELGSGDGGLNGRVWVPPVAKA